MAVMMMRRINKKSNCVDDDDEDGDADTDDDGDDHGDDDGDGDGDGDDDDDDDDDHIDDDNFSFCWISRSAADRLTMVLYFIDMGY